MPRLNNKDFTVEELERMISLLNTKMDQKRVMGEGWDGIECEILELLKGTTLGEIPQEPHPIMWNFSFKMEMHPDSLEQARIIKDGMRSKEVVQNIEGRFRVLVYEELNWYKNRVDVFMIKGDSNILE